MSRHNYKSSATVGEEFQTKIENMLDSAKIPHRAEKTLSNSKIRKLDKKADYEVYPNDNPIYLEVKTSEHNKTVGYCLYQSSKKVWLKFHQICRMDWLVVEWRFEDENIMVKISKKDFLKFAGAHKKNSFNYKDSLEMGEVITDMEWLRRD